VRVEYDNRRDYFRKELLVCLMDVMWHPRRIKIIVQALESMLDLKRLEVSSKLDTAEPSRLPWCADWCFVELTLHNVECQNQLASKLRGTLIANNFRLSSLCSNAP